MHFVSSPARLRCTIGFCPTLNQDSVTSLDGFQVMERRSANRMQAAECLGLAPENTLYKKNHSWNVYAVSELSKENYLQLLPIIIRCEKGAVINQQLPYVCSYHTDCGFFSDHFQFAIICTAATGTP